MRRFVARALLSAGGLMAAVAGFNLAVDPYALFGTPAFPGVNMVKTEESEPHLAKSYLVERVKPRTLLLGNSSVGIGFDPESAAWPAELRPVFNLAVGFASPYTSLRLLQHALATTSPELVVIGLTAESFVPNLPQSRDYESRLRVRRDGSPNPDRAWAQVNDAAFALGSWTALRDSMLTVMHQRDPGIAAVTPLGFNQGGQLEAAIRRIGYQNKFAHQEHMLSTRASAWARNPRIDLEPVREMIELAHRRGARIIVLVPPGHAVEAEVFRRVGAQAMLAQWHHELVEMVEAQARTGARVQLWDFSGRSRYNSEPVPTAGDGTAAMRWYWDPPHFKPALGDLVIARLMGGGPPDLGTVLAGAKTDAPCTPPRTFPTFTEATGMAPVSATLAGAQQTSLQPAIGTSHPCPPPGP